MANEALRRAVDIAGGQKPLAERIGSTQSHVWYWLERSKKGVPAQYCLAIERETGVSVHELRPDVFPIVAQSGQSQPGSEIVGGEGAALGHDGETAADGRSGHAISADAALRAEAGR